MLLCMSTQTILAGIVPFGCLFIEMYFILSAVWSHNKIYYVYGFMFAILVLLCLVIVCVSITCTYILLNAEDYRWQWQSYISCAATALYVFLYTIHYFYNSTQMLRPQLTTLSCELQWIPAKTYLVVRHVKVWLLADGVLLWYVAEFLHRSLFILRLPGLYWLLEVRVSHIQQHQS